MATDRDDTDDGKRSRRDFIKTSATIAGAVSALEVEACAPLFRHLRPAVGPPQRHTVIIIGSLIYSNVSLEPFRPNPPDDCPVMHGWPIKLTRSDYDLARDWMTRWRGVLNNVVTTVPLDDTLKGALSHLEAVTQSGTTKDYSYLYLPRSRALKRSAARLKGSTKMVEDWAPLPLQIFEHGGTAAATLAGQRFCERQGRCFLGCLPGARHTLNKAFFGGDKLLRYITSKQLIVRPLSNAHHVTKEADGTWSVSYYDIVTGNEYDSSQHAVFKATEDLLKQFATAMDEPNKLDRSKTARYVAFPLWSGILGSPKLVVTHPLGGCIMAANAEEGAVSTEGRLYSSHSGTAVHKGLFVMDGSVSPGPVAVNPSLTIVALALRIAQAAKSDVPH